MPSLRNFSFLLVTGSSSSGIAIVAMPLREPTTFWDAIQCVLEEHEGKKWCEATWSSSAWCFCLLMSKVSFQDQPSAGLFARSSQSDENPVELNASQSVGKTSVYFLYWCLLGHLIWKTEKQDTKFYWIWTEAERRWRIILVLPEQTNFMMRKTVTGMTCSYSLKHVVRSEVSCIKLDDVTARALSW